LTNRSICLTRYFSNVYVATWWWRS